MTYSESALFEIFETLDENEKFGVSVGIFPIRLESYKLDNHECAKLITFAQSATGVVY
jgi:hypothetical protein